MRVIEESLKEFEIECRGCFAKLGAEVGDVRFHARLSNPFSSKVFGAKKHYYHDPYFICDSCGKEISIFWNDKIPKNWIQRSPDIP